MTEYTIYDRRNGELVGSSVQPDVSAKSENAALRSVGFVRSTEFAEIVTREISEGVARPWVGKVPGR